MTTLTWSTPADHADDATFRAWGSELNTKLAAAGLVQTADTGQIDWTSVARPSGGSDAGYEIWRFSDSLQGTKPIFIRINYGTYFSATVPRMQVMVGTGTNGSGTLTGPRTGAGSTFYQITGTNTPGSGTNYASYLCYTGGHLALAWKIGTAQSLLVVSRSIDSSTGADTGDGAIAYFISPFGTHPNLLDFNASTNKDASQVPCFVPFAVTSTTNSGNVAALQHYAPYPDFRVVKACCTILNTEISGFTTFSATLEPSGPHTYLSLAGSAIAAETGSVTGTYSPAMIWE